MLWLIDSHNATKNRFRILSSERMKISSPLLRISLLVGYCMEEERSKDLKLSFFRPISLEWQKSASIPLVHICQSDVSLAL